MDCKVKGLVSIRKHRRGKCFAVQRLQTYRTAYRGHRTAVRQFPLMLKTNYPILVETLHVTSLPISFAVLLTTGRSESSFPESQTHRKTTGGLQTAVYQLLSRNCSPPSVRDRRSPTGRPPPASKTRESCKTHTISHSVCGSSGSLRGRILRDRRGCCSRPGRC